MRIIIGHLNGPQLVLSIILALAGLKCRKRTRFPAAQYRSVSVFKASKLEKSATRACLKSIITSSGSFDGIKRSVNSRTDPKYKTPCKL